MEMTSKKPCTGRDLDLPSAAAEKIGCNEDLIREILLYVPTRSLVRFESVSNQWCHVITDNKFSLRHTLRRSCFIPSGLYFYNSLTNSQEIESVSLMSPQVIPNQTSVARVRVPSMPFRSASSIGAKMKIIQACNGLFLCCLTNLSNPDVKLYCVSNPTTGKCNLLPIPPSEVIAGCSLAFDPQNSPHYKIVCVKRVNPWSRLLFRCQIVIYSSEDDRCKTTDCEFEMPPHMVADGGVYWNGMIHWIVPFQDDPGHYNYGVHFDVNAEKLTRIVSLPPKPQGNSREMFRYFGVYNGSLHLVYVRSRTARKFNVLEIDRDTLKWSVKYCVHLRRLISVFPEIVVKKSQTDTQYAFQILCVVKGEKEKNSALVLAIPGKVISYNFMSKTSKVLSADLPTRVDEGSHFHFASAYQYIETLCPVEHSLHV